VVGVEYEPKGAIEWASVFVLVVVGNICDEEIVDADEEARMRPGFEMLPMEVEEVEERRAGLLVLAAAD